MSKPQYVLATGDLAVGASKLMADLYNATGSGYKVHVHGLYVRPTSDVAVTGVVSARYNFFLTTAAGTSGTSVGYASASETAASIIPLDSLKGGLPSGITARTAPAGGATIAARLASTFGFPEETSASVTVSQNMNILKDGQVVVLHPGKGLLIKQGSVASVGSFEFEVHFTVEEEE